eukprot:scaffold60557_cov48-Phaeocystis_antarctica.AAC.4
MVWRQASTWLGLGVGVGLGLGLGLGVGLGGRARVRVLEAGVDRLQHVERLDLRLQADGLHARGDGLGEGLPAREVQLGAQRLDLLLQCPGAWRSGYVARKAGPEERVVGCAERAFGCGRA